jgi:hypothetical protein
VGGVVCIAAANAGATSQDLKTGYLVGATPSYQQLGLFAGVTASAFIIGLTLIGMNKGLEKFEPVSLALDVAALPEGVVVEGTKEHAGKTYTLLNSIGSRTVAEGKYLLDPASGKVELQWIQGIGSQDATAPQARLMSVVINGILTRRLPWGLVLLGVFLVVAVELLGVRSLSFAVGSYLSIGTTAAIFCGGIVRWLAERGRAEREEGEASPGALFASGLIAAGGIVGLLAIALRLVESAGWLPQNSISFAVHVVAPIQAAIAEATKAGREPILSLGQNLALVVHSHALGIVAFGLLAYSAYHFARKPLK